MIDTLSSDSNHGNTDTLVSGLRRRVDLVRGRLVDMPGVRDHTGRWRRKRRLATDGRSEVFVPDGMCALGFPDDLDIPALAGAYGWIVHVLVRSLYGTE